MVAMCGRAQAHPAWLSIQIRVKPRAMSAPRSSSGYRGCVRLWSRCKLTPRGGLA
jgi:hypothetical protein